MNNSHFSLDNHYKYYYEDMEKSSILWRTESVSLDNDYIPLHALFCGKKITQGEKSILVYQPSFVMPTRYYTTTFKNHEKFFQNLSTGSGWCKIVKSNITKQYYNRMGELVEFDPANNTVTLLFTIAAKQKYLFKINKEAINLDQFVLLVNKDFVENPDHSNMYRAFCKYYLDEAAKTMDVVISRDINKGCYTPLVVKPKPAKNIVEMKKNMFEFHKLVLNTATTKT